LNLFLRLYANCDDASDADRLAGQIALALSAWGSSPTTQPRQYWKMPELYEFAVDLFPATVETFHAVHALASGKWHDDVQACERSSVWNRVADHSFLIPEVTWAHLELYESAL
jgi:hypothetical protein